MGRCWENKWPLVAEQIVERCYTAKTNGYIYTRRLYADTITIILFLPELHTAIPILTNRIGTVSNVILNTCRKCHTFTAYDYTIIISYMSRSVTVSYRKNESHKGAYTAAAEHTSNAVRRYYNTNPAAASFWRFCVRRETDRTYWYNNNIYSVVKTAAVAYNVRAVLVQTAARRK